MKLSIIFRSDGSQPHSITVQFLKKMRIQVMHLNEYFFAKKYMKEIAMYLDFKTDESYTPNKISVRAGNNLQDLKVIKIKEKNLAQINYSIGSFIH